MNNIVNPAEGTPLAPEDPIADGIIVAVGPEDEEKKDNKTE